jgi:hypothetical protein
MMRLNIGFLPALIPPGRFVLRPSWSSHYPAVVLDKPAWSSEIRHEAGLGPRLEMPALERVESQDADQASWALPAGNCAPCFTA